VSVLATHHLDALRAIAGALAAAATPAARQSVFEDAAREAGAWIVDGDLGAEAEQEVRDRLYEIGRVEGRLADQAVQIIMAAGIADAAAEAREAIIVEAAADATEAAEAADAAAESAEQATRAAGEWARPYEDQAPRRNGNGGVRPDRQDGAEHAAAKPVAATRFVWRDPASMPRLPWLYGRQLVRKFVSATIATSRVGKTKLLIAEALAMVTGRPLLGVKPAGPLKVWLWNGEDPRDHLERQIIGACLHYRIDPREFEGRLFLDSGRDAPIVIAQQTIRTGTVIAEPVVAQLIQTIRANAIDVLIVEPFVTTHRVGENDNMAIDAVAKTFNRIAEAGNVAIALAHHARKSGGADISVEDARGASSWVAVARYARVLNRMTKDEAAKLGISQPWRFVRADAESNLTAAAENATWYQFISVGLGNCSAPNVNDGDEVGAIAAWSPPDLLAGFTEAHMLAAQKAVDAGGPWRENIQATDWVGAPVAEALGLDLDDQQDRARVKAALKAWTAAGLFVIVERPDARRHPKAFVEVGEWVSS
jgi:hypothetical protein